MPSDTPLLVIRPDNQSSIGPSGLGVGIALAVLATLVVPLRFWARRLTKIKFGIDDYLVTAALVFHHGFAITAALVVFVGGTGSDDKSDADVLNDTRLLYKTIYAGQWLYGLSSPLVKMAILAFLWRTFPTREVQISCIVLSALSVAWTLAAQILNFVECRPIQAFWEPNLRAIPSTHCIDFVAYDLGLAIANALIDLATLIVPIHEILKLNISTSKKVGVCAIFAIGGVTFAASALRAITLGLVVGDGGSTYTNTYLISGLATVVEIYAAVIGACVPLLVPVYRKLRYGTLYITQATLTAKTKSATGASSSTARNDSTDHGHGAFHELHDFDVPPLVPRTANRRMIGVRAEESEDDVHSSFHGIRVTQSFEWHSQQKDSIDV